MLWWNRKEIYFGYSGDEFNRIRQKLTLNGFRYDYRLVNQNNRRGQTGSFCENPALSVAYYLYVHKSEYDKVNAILSGQIRAI